MLYENEQGHYDPYAEPTEDSAYDELFDEARSIYLADYNAERYY